MCVHVLGDESNRIKMGKWKKCTWSLVCTCSQLVKHRTARLSFASTHFHLMLLMADEPPRANSRFHSYVLNFFFFFVFRFGPCSAPLIWQRIINFPWSLYALPSWNGFDWISQKVTYTWGQKQRTPIYWFLFENMRRWTLNILMDRASFSSYSGRC